MPITIACRCGQKLNVKDELAGKRVKCPKCGAALSIPGSDPSVAGSARGDARAAPASKAAHRRQDDAFDEIGLILRGEGEAECPSCRSAVPKNAVLCVNCGYNFQSGQRIQTLGKSQADPEPRTAEVKTKSEVDKMIEFAEDELEKEPVKQDLGYGSRSSAWVITLIMIAIFGVVLAGGMAFFNHVEGEAATKAREKAAKSR
ncbi:MAG: hypothetical protein FJ297_07110 [Planctomycetes bacterium]|nr:hypothetical protein [Planctomycetota bacterium]